MDFGGIILCEKQLYFKKGGGKCNLAGELACFMGCMVSMEEYLLS